MRRSPSTRRVLVGLSLVAFAAPALPAEDRFAKKLGASRAVLEELLAIREDAPNSLLADAHCVAVIPSVAAGAFVFGGRHGRGVLTCRDGAGGWSPIMFVELSGGSVGFQAGGEATDLVLFFMNERGARSLLDTRFILGGDATIAAGPVGRTAEASTDLKFKAEIYSYAKSRGLFAGAAIQGARLAPDFDWSRDYYGERVWPEDVLFEQQAPPMTPEGRAFLEALP
jgi:lipid-binding SYLF domain-containing protein